LDIDDKGEQKQTMIDLINTLRKPLRRLNAYLYQNNKEKFSSASRQKILDQFPEPGSLAERSWFQYRCQMKEAMPIVRAVQSVAALVLLPFYYGRHYHRFPARRPTPARRRPFI
jgi:hypothetical protein